MDPSNCECECDKSHHVGAYLDYENCKWRKRLVDKLVEECNENIDEAKLTEIAFFEHVNGCSYIVCIVLGVIVLTICIGIGAYSTYKYINLNKENISIYDYIYQAKNC